LSYIKDFVRVKSSKSLQEARNKKTRVIGDQLKKVLDKPPA